MVALVTDPLAEISVANLEIKLVRLDFLDMFISSVSVFQ